MRRWLFAVVLLTATPALAQRKPFTAEDRARVEAKQAEEAAKPKKRDGKDIVETAEAAGDFKTFLALAEEAGVTETLQGPGPLTVFAPNDAAFRKVPKKKLAALKADKEKLKSVLLYHVVVGQLGAETLEKMPARSKVRTASTEEVTVSKQGRKLKINKAGLVKTDIATNNGVIHVVDTVLLPAPPPPAKRAKK